MPNTSVQAEFQMPSMMTRSWRSRMRILCLVFLDITAVVTGDMQVGAGRACGQIRQENQGNKRDAHGAVGLRQPRDRCSSLRGPEGTSLARLCLNFVKHAGGSKSRPLVADLPHFSCESQEMGARIDPKCILEIIAAARWVGDPRRKRSLFGRVENRFPAIGIML